MAIFRVCAKSIGYVYLDVEANSAEEAKRIAEEADGGDFIEDSGGWEWDEVYKKED